MHSRNQLLRLSVFCALVFGIMAPSVVATASAQDNYPLFGDDFEVPGDFSTTWTVMDGSYAIESGGFGSGLYWAHGTASVENDPAMILSDAAALDWADYTLEYDVRFTSNDSWCYSFGFIRLQSNTAWTVPTGPPDGYRINLKANQNLVTIDRIQGGVSTQIGANSWTIDPGTDYHVAVQAYGSEIRVYVNGATALIVTDDTFAAGTVALSGSTGGGSSTSIDIYYDNVTMDVSRECHTGYYAALTEDFEGRDPLGYYWGIPDGTVVVEAGDFGFGSYRAHGSASGENNGAIIFRDPEALNWEKISLQADVEISSNDSYCYMNFNFGLPSVSDWTVPMGPPNGYTFTLKNNQDVAELAKTVDNVTTVLATVPLVVSQNTHYFVRIDFDSPNIAVYVNGALVLEATDATFSSGTVAFDGGTGGGGSTSVDIFWDNITVCADDYIPTYQVCQFTEEFEIPGFIPYDWTVMDGTAEQEVGGVFNPTAYVHTHGEGENDGAIMCTSPVFFDSTDFQVNLDVMISSNDAYCYSFIYFCVQDTTDWVVPQGPPNAYQVALKNYQDVVELSVRTGGVNNVLDTHPYPVNRGETYTVGIVHHGNGLIEVYVNAMPVISYLDNTYGSGSIALSGSTGGGSGMYVDAYYDNVNVCPAPYTALAVNPENNPTRVRPTLSPWPNPSAGRSTIEFNLSQPGLVQLQVYDVAGRLIDSLPAEHLDTGYHTLTWDLRRRSSGEYGAGIYFLRLATPDGVKVGRVLIQK